MKVTPEEVDVLLREGEKMAPILAQTRILRAYAGVRPLVASDNDPSGRIYHNHGGKINDLPVDGRVDNRFDM